MSASAARNACPTTDPRHAERVTLASGLLREPHLLDALDHLPEAALHVLVDHGRRSFGARAAEEGTSAVRR